MRGLALALLFAGAFVLAAHAEPRSKAMAILDKAIAGEKDSKVLAQALTEVEALLAKNSRDADAHYTRGWVLSRSNRNDDAVAAYDRAFELDPRLVDAAYNAGVVLGRAGNSKDAVIRFERVLKAYPKHVDAAFNAGQSYYDLNNFGEAAARWETAAKLSPDDFQIAKKLVQAYVALGKPDKIKTARDRVFAMWKSGKNPDLAGLKSYVYDQFTVGVHHVYVYETFEPGNGAIYIAKVIAKDKVIGSVTLEQAGSKYTVGVDKNGAHSTLTDEWKKAPDYKTWKPIAAKAIEAQF